MRFTRLISPRTEISRTDAMRAPVIDDDDDDAIKVVGELTHACVRSHARGPTV